MEFLRKLDWYTVAQIVLILAGMGLGTLLTQMALRWLAERLSGRLRLYLLASVPMLRLTLIVAAFVLIVPRVVEPTFENLFALLGAVGLALGFAFKDYISSLIAGIVTLYEMPYRLGDWISIDGTYGEVRSIGMRVVQIVTPDDTVVLVPHLKLWDRLLFNANDGSQHLMCVIDFPLRSPHQPQQIINTLRDVGLTSAFLQVRKPVKVAAINKSWGVRYRIKAYPVNPRDQFRLITDLTMRGRAALAELGVRFAECSIEAESES